MRILALDLATKVGWAFSDGNGALISGVQDCTVHHRESRGMLYVRFGGWLRGFLAQQPVDLIVYEQPHLRGGGASTVCVGLETRVHEVHAESAASWQYTAVHGATALKVVLGSANPGGVKRGAAKGARREANKAASTAWATAKLGRAPQDDNEADALMLLEWARVEFGGKAGA